MHPVLDRRHQRVYAGMWVTFAAAITLYVAGVAILHLPGIVAALIFAPIPGIALIVLAFRIRPAGFQVRGRFLLDDGQAIERAIPIYLPGKPSDDALLVHIKSTLERLRTDGHQFHDEHGRPTELLNQPGKAQTRLVVRGTFRLNTGETVTRTVACRLPAAIDPTNFRDVRTEIVEGLRADGYRFAEGVGHLVEVENAIYL